MQARRPPTRVAAAAVVLLAIAAVTGAAPRTSTRAAASPPPGVGCPILPADDVWHADVSSLPVRPESDAWMASMGGTGRRIHPDFGPSGSAQPYGIPYAVVDSSHPRTSVTFDYADESDAGPYPFGPDTPIESGSDRHALMLDRDACVLYELYAADENGGSPTAGSGAVFDLRSYALRPAGWTSADAAGLPIFPGLLRLDEVQAGEVDHAIRMTAATTDKTFVWPARHQAGARRDPSLPPMGAWFRMKASFDISGFSPMAQVVLRAFKTHGLVVADNGSNWYFTGSADDGWPTAVLDELKTIPAGAFEAVDVSALMVSPDSGQVRAAATIAPAPAPPPPASPATAAPPAGGATAAPAPSAAPPTTTNSRAAASGSDASALESGGAPSASAPVEMSDPNSRAAASGSDASALESGGAPSTTAPVESVTTRPTSATRRGDVPWPLVAAPVLLAIAGGFALALASRRRRPPPKGDATSS